MIAFAGRHLVESTFFCVLLSALASCFRKGAGAQYAVWLIAISKFAIPSVLLASTGARLALFWPATFWLSSVARSVSDALAAILGMLPSTIVNGDAGTYRTILFGWALGTTGMLVIWFVRLRNSEHRLIPPTGREQEIMDRARDLLGISVPVQLRASEALSGPALRGLWRATVIVPRGLSQRLTASEFEAVLLHELAHARRFDNLAAVFVHGLVCVFWFHPLLWLLERRLNIEREHACDEAVIACGTRPQVYVAGIVKTCKFHLFEPVSGVSAMAGADLKHRLEHILKHQFSRPFSYVPRLMIAALALLMTMVPIAGGYCQQCVSSGQALATARRERSPADPCPSVSDKNLARSCSK